MKNAFLGIDLGTTYSAGAYIDDQGNAQIITNSEGNNTTPSVVFLEQKDHVIVGQTAKDNRCVFPGRVVDLVKNSMGKVNPDQTPVMIETDFGTYMPEAISSFILKKIVADANARLGLTGGDEIQDVVVTIPAYFDDAQRTATDNAISMAGLNRLGFINEPTAAALYYAKQTDIEEANILVYDLGGGTFDVSIVHIAGHAREVVSTNGIQKAGGSLFDKEIVERISADFLAKYDIDLTKPEYADVRQELYGKAERAKIQLSTAMTAMITLRVGSVSETYEMTREDLEEIVGKLYRKTEACIRVALKDASLTPEQIDKVVLVGGCSRIPYIYEHIKEYFGKEPCRDVNPDEVVALGAAIYAKQLKEGKDVEISDVNSHSIGIRAINPKTGLEFNDILIKRNTRLPASVERGYILRGTEVQSLFINVFEGEYKEISDVSEICGVDVDVPVDGKKDTRVFIKLEIDKYQMLHMYVRLPDAGNLEREITFERKSNMSKAQVSEWKEAHADAVSSIEGRKAKKEEGAEPKRKGGFFSKMFGDASSKESEEKATEEKLEGKDASSKEDELIMPAEKKVSQDSKKEDPAKKIPPAVQKVMEDVIGMEEVAEAMRDYKNRFDMDQKRSSFGRTDEFSHCVAIYGKPGLGVTTAAVIVANCLHKLGIVEAAVPVIATYDDIVKEDGKDTTAAIQELFEKAMNGVLIIDDFHKFQNENENASGMMATDLLLKAYEDSKHQVAIVVAGYGKEMKLLMEAKPKFARLFLTNSIDMVGYSAGEYVQILHSVAAQRGYVIDDFADAELERNIKGMMKLPDFKHIYYLTDELLDPAITNAANIAGAKRRATADDYTIIRKEHFSYRETKKSLAELLEELDSLTGLEKVKEQVHVLIKKQETIQRSEREGKKLPGDQGAMHMVFMGNAGTGKTVVARLIAEIYRELGVISKGQLVEVGRSKLISEFVGKTAQVVADRVNEAMGGVLFIDEAYALCRDENDTVGLEALNELIAHLENHRRDFVCIMAGYTKDMEAFMDRNQGLVSRFPNRIDFEDYSLDELMEIFMGMVSKDGYIIEKKALDAARNLISERMRMPGFGNGRGVREIYAKIHDAQTVRIGEMSDWGENEHRIIRVEDIGQKDVEEAQPVEKYLQKLNELIGLSGVKQQVSTLVSTAQVNKMRQEMGIQSSGAGTLHMVFSGNPGTGKTTVARLIGKIYHALGLIPSDRFVEVGRADLVGQYVGTTAPKTTSVVNSALGGVLFIDEAYQLKDKDSSGGYGAEAIDTLVALLENHRNDFVCIVAGYTEPMEEFLDQNPGLKSRFPTNIEFEDYSLDELCQICDLIVGQMNWTMTEKAREKARDFIAYKSLDKDFGNGRGVRNIVEKVMKAHADVRISSKIAAGETLTREDLVTILPEDIY